LKDAEFLPAVELLESGFKALLRGRNGTHHDAGTAPIEICGDRDELLYLKLGRTNYLKKRFFRRGKDAVAAAKAIFGGTRAPAGE